MDLHASQLRREQAELQLLVQVLGDDLRIVADFEDHVRGRPG